MSERVLLLCPGRGSYTAAELGSLAGIDDDPRVAALRDLLASEDPRRRAGGAEAVREMDAAGRFHSRFLRGENAAPLIFSVGVHDALRIDPARARVVAVAGNSMGWYTALWCAGAVDLSEGWRLVTTMGDMTRDGTIGGQLVYPVVDDDWRADAGRAAAVQAALEGAHGRGRAAGLSIRYGGIAVLWAEEAALGELEAALPPLRLGRRDYPLRLQGNSAFHSSLMRPVSEQALRELSDLHLVAPRVPLIDGRGTQWRPLTSPVEELLEYTLRTQVTETFDFSAAVRVALREYAPDRIVLLGPGDSLGAAVAQVLIAERWQGIDSREAFTRRQEDDPVVLSMARPDQAERVR